MDSRGPYDGSGSPDIVRVTNLNDSGSGSLREAVEGSGLSPRFVIFEISGTLVLESDIAITSPYITVAGQTAPPPGIALRGGSSATSSAGGLVVYGHHVLVQHIRARPGDGDPLLPQTAAHDGILIYDLSGTYTPHHIILDHCSISWTGDKAANIIAVNNGNLTLWRCIISESLYRATNVIPQAGSWGAPNNPPSSLGLLIGNHVTQVSIIQCALLHNSDRNPEWHEGASFQFINNVVYDWGRDDNPYNWASFGYGPAADPWFADIIGNVYIAGISAHPNLPLYAIGTWVGDVGSSIYINDNILDETAASITPYFNNMAFDPRVGSPTNPIAGQTILPASSVRALVLANAGTMPAYRDAVDTRVTNDADNYTGTVISSQDEVGGWPVLAMIPRALTTPSSPHFITSSGYSNLEIWLHGYADVVEGVVVDPVDITGFGDISMPHPTLTGAGLPLPVSGSGSFTALAPSIDSAPPVASVTGSGSFTAVAPMLLSSVVVVSSVPDEDVPLVVATPPPIPKSLTIDISDGFGPREYLSSLYNVDQSFSHTKNMPALFTFSLVQASGDTSFVAPKRGAHVVYFDGRFEARDRKATSGILFSGWITNEPQPTFLGLNRNQLTGEVWSYRCECTSEDFIANIKSLPPTIYINKTRGYILRDLLTQLFTIPVPNKLADGIVPVIVPFPFDLSGIKDGGVEQIYQVDTSKKFSDVAKEMGDADGYAYRFIDGRVFYAPQSLPVRSDSDPRYALVIDHKDPRFVPGNLNLKRVASPITNDLTVIGNNEGTTLVHESFISDGYQGFIPLAYPPFGVAETMLLTDDFTADTIDDTLWTVGPGDIYLEPFQGSLNILGGLGGTNRDTYIISKKAIELCGILDIRDGEVFFPPSPSGSGFIGGLHATAVPTDFGIVSGWLVEADTKQIWAIADGAKVPGGVLPIDTNMSYVLRRHITVDRPVRQYNAFSQHLHATSASYGGIVAPPATATITYTADQVDSSDVNNVITTRAIVAYAVVQDPPAFVLYAPILNSNLHAVMNFVSIFKPIQVEVLLGGVQAQVGNFLDGGVCTITLDTPPTTTNQSVQTSDLGHARLSFYATKAPSAFTPTALLPQVGVITIPPMGTRIEVIYRKSDVSRTRMQSTTSIASERARFRDDGIRKKTLRPKDMNPVPRTSEECIFYAQAYLSDNSTPLYEGSYSFETNESDATYLAFWPIAGDYVRCDVPLPDGTRISQDLIVETVNSNFLGKGAYQIQLTFGSANRFAIVQRNLLLQRQTSLSDPAIVKTDILSAELINATDRQQPEDIPSIFVSNITPTTVDINVVRGLAVMGDNLIVNGDFNGDNGLVDWKDEGNGFPNLLGVPPSWDPRIGPDGIMFVNPGDAFFGAATSLAFAVDDARSYKVGMYIYSQVETAGFDVSFLESTSSAGYIQRVVAFTTPDTNEIALTGSVQVFGGILQAGWHFYAGDYTPTLGTKWASMLVRNGTGDIYYTFYGPASPDVPNLSLSKVPPYSPIAVDGIDVHAYQDTNLLTYELRATDAGWGSLLTTNFAPYTDVNPYTVAGNSLIAWFAPGTSKITVPRSKRDMRFFVRPFNLYGNYSRRSAMTRVVFPLANHTPVVGVTYSISETAVQVNIPYTQDPDVAGFIFYGPQKPLSNGEVGLIYQGDGVTTLFLWDGGKPDSGVNAIAGAGLLSVQFPAYDGLTSYWISIYTYNLLGERGPLLNMLIDPNAVAYGGVVALAPTLAGVGTSV